MAGNPQVAAAEDAKKAAYELILGSGKEVFDLSKEKQELRSRYGRHTFGQECLVARRLVESGVPYVVINYPGGWDTHSNHFSTMRRQCPQLDQGLAALLADLKDRGLLESTLVWCCGEFGRSPEDRLAAALERRPQPLRQRLQRAGRRRRIQGRARRRGVGREGRRSQGPAGLSRRPAGQHLSTWPASTPTPGLPHPMGFEAHVLPDASEGVKSAGLLTEIM